jgi:hypothetical protein
VISKPSIAESCPLMGPGSVNFKNEPEPSPFAFET